MLADFLGDLLSVDRVKPLLDAAVRDRECARLAYAERAAALADIRNQVASGIWRNPQVEGAAAQVTSDQLLLRMNAQKYIDAHGGACDLDNEYHPLLPQGQPADLDGTTTALAFVEAARPKDSAELWIAALQSEAASYLHQLRGDHYLAQALDSLGALESQLLELLDPSDPYEARNFLVHAAILSLFREMQLAWRVEAAYRRFLAGFTDDPFAGWRARAEADPQYENDTAEAYLTIVVNALDALKLRNPAHRTEIERLTAELPREGFAPSLLLYEPDAFALPDLPPSAFAAAAAALHRLADAVAPANGASKSRPSAVLAAWTAFAQRGLRQFRELAEGLAAAEADREALGILVRGLRGEARYRMGRYEDAYLDLLDAETAARAALGRRAVGADDDPTTWNAAERDGVARFAQKAGNALVAIGDEERARKAYERAAVLALDPLARAGNLLNQGNLQFLHNSVVGDQGYITLDGLARQDFVLHGPEGLTRAVVGQHVASLCEAERCYRAALEALAGLDPAAPGVQAVAASCHINLGSIGWAWGRTLAGEGAGKLGELPLDERFTAQLVNVGSDAANCYEAAVGEYEAGLAVLGAERGNDALSVTAVPLAAAALSSLSEMRYLLARELLRGASEKSDAPALSLQPQPPAPGSPAFRTVTKGIDEAGRCLALIARDGAHLYPDLIWRTNYNLARSYRLLGKTAKASSYYRRAIRAVERLRADLRLEAFQAAFLHDKHDVYEGYIDLLLEQSLLQEQPGRTLPQIFELFERSRARAFLTLLQAAHVSKALPDALRGEVEALLAKVSACNEAIQAAVGADNQAETEALLAEQSRLADVWADMQSRIAEAQRWRFPTRVPGLAEFQAALAEDQAYLGILLGDEASYALLIDRTSARVFRLPPRRALELLALPVLSYATWSNSETGVAFRAANVALATALLGPIDAEINLKTWLAGKHVLVSPDGIFCYLPFDLLFADLAGVASLPASADYPDFVPHYLLSLADISYVPSASAWLELGRRKPRASKAGLMVVYNVLYDTPDPPLWAVAQNILLKLSAVTSPPDIARLTQAIQAAWPGSDVVKLRSRADDGSPEAPAYQSTESNFLKVAPDARPRILMFDGHGIYNDRYPSLSGLVFNLSAPAKPDERAAIPTADDGFLRVEELFQLEMPGAELTLLGACQTALGAYRRGEGLNALVRGFLYRGSPAVVATLWEVRGDMTRFLLRVFVKLLGEQPQADRGRLFSQAKRKAIPYVANLCLPYFWAPFVLWGHSHPRSEWKEST